MPMFSFATTFLLFAARRSSDSNLTPEQYLLIFGVCIAGMIVIGIAKAMESARKRKMQQKIDENHQLEYRSWHRQIECSGEIKPISCNLILSNGEECLRYETNVTLFEVRSVRNSVHTGGSMPLGKTGIRLGRAYSTSESTDEWRPIAKGQLYVTNKQIYFDGDKQDRKIPLSKISTIKADWSGIEVSSDTRQKSMIFMGLNGNICRDIVLCALGQKSF